MYSCKIEDVEKLYLNLKESEDPFVKQLFKGFKKVRKKLISISKINLMNKEEKKISENELKAISEKKYYENEFYFYQQSYNLYTESRKVKINLKEKDKDKEKQTKHKLQKQKEDSKDNSSKVANPNINSNDDDINDMLKNLARFFLIQSIDEKEKEKEKAQLDLKDTSKVFSQTEIKEIIKKIMKINYSDQDKIQFDSIEEKLISNLKGIMLGSSSKIDSKNIIDFNSLNFAITQILKEKYNLDINHSKEGSNSLPKKITRKENVKSKEEKKKISTKINKDHKPIQSKIDYSSKAIKEANPEYLNKEDLKEVDKEDSDDMNDLNLRNEDIMPPPQVAENEEDFSDDNIPQLRNGGKILKNIDKSSKIYQKTWCHNRSKGGYSDL